MEGTFERLSSISFFLKRGFDNPMRVFSFQISLLASWADGNVTFMEGVPFDGGLAFLGGNLLSVRWMYVKETVEPTSV